MPVKVFRPKSKKKSMIMVMGEDSLILCCMTMVVVDGYHQFGLQADRRSSYIYIRGPCLLAISPCIPPYTNCQTTMHLKTIETPDSQRLSNENWSSRVS